MSQASENQSALPNTIPASQNFIGRKSYLHDLHESYQKGECAFVLYGTGGVGKSALALKFAEEIENDYAAKIFVDMQGLKNPLSARDAMYEIVRQFNPQISADIPDAQLKAFFTSFVQAQPTLIILDNAESEEQVASLVNAKNACVIISSRNGIELTKGETKRLKKMIKKDAEALLFSIAGKEKFKERADELAELADYLPMALKPLAKLLKKKFKTIDGILKEYKQKRLEITDVDHENLSVKASFQLSYDALSPELQEHWRQLAVFPADFESKAASTVFGLDFEEGWNIVQELYDYSLIEEDTKSTSDEPRFSLHDLAREFADKQLSDEERFNAPLRHAFYYSSVLQTTGQRVENYRENGFINALNLLDREWNNIIAGQKWAANLVEQSDEIARLCLDYSGYGRYFLILRLHPRKDIEWLESGLKASQKLNKVQTQGNHLGNLGSAYEKVGEYEKAIKYHEQALAIYHEVANQLGEATSLGNLGVAYFRLNDYQKAIKYFEQALIISRQIGDLSGEGRHLGNLGATYANSKEYRKAIEYHMQALSIKRRIGNRYGEGISLSNLGTAYHDSGEYQEAIKYYENALIIAREIGDKQGEGTRLGNLGNTYSDLGEKDKACDLWQEAVAILEAIESPNANIYQQNLKENCES